ncbi:MAG: DUF881 domain-containing protein [Clostridia bacterium]|nr:DUF881 domain-containing protein [Clostridia bacterium]
MKKGKITVAITITITCFALTTVMFMQFKIVKETDITSIETMREEELRTELANWKQLYNEADEQYQEKSEKLKEYREKQQSTEESTKLIEKELSQIDMYLGKTEVQGEGIIINIKDINNDEEIPPISAEDLLVIVDYLKLAGAEAISINEQRIVNMSDIVYVNNSIIYVNQQRILAPYVINAIGDSVTLESTLLGNGGYVETLKNIGFEVDIQRQNKVIIPKYNKEIGHKYIQ